MPIPLTTFAMSTSTTKSSARTATKRLMQELADYNSDPNPALLHLGPVDGDLFKWTAVLKGVEGTAYEGMLNICLVWALRGVAGIWSVDCM